MNPKPNNNYTNNRISSLCLPTYKEFIVINIDEILYCEANGNNTIIYCTDNSFKEVNYRLHTIENMLINASFFRSHKSQLINLQHISSISRDRNPIVTFKNGANTEIAVRRKKELLEVLGKSQAIMQSNTILHNN